MATSFTNENKNDSTFENEEESIRPAKFGKAKFGESKFDRGGAGSGQSYDNEDKNDSNYSNETKN